MGNDDRVLRITKGDWGNVTALYVAKPDPDLESVGHSIERPDSPGITADKRQAYRVSLGTAENLQAFLTARGFQAIVEFADDDPDSKQQREPAPQANFKYYSVMVNGEARGLFVFNDGGKRLDMISWHHDSKTWEHDPAFVSRYFISDLDAEEISRTKAEQVAQGFGATVPSELEFMEISDLHERKLKSGKDRVLRIGKKGEDLRYVADTSHDPESDGVLELTTEKGRALRVSLDDIKKAEALLTALGYRVVVECDDDDPFWRIYHGSIARKSRPK
jgi:hypothetical protein